MTVPATGSLGGYDDDDDDVLFFSGSDYVFIVFFFPVTFSIFFVSFCIFFCKCSKTKLIMTLNKNIFYNVYRFISFLSLLRWVYFGIPNLYNKKSKSQPFLLASRQVITKVFQRLHAYYLLDTICV